MVAALVDNVLKPPLLNRGLPIPILIIFWTRFGGFIAKGIIGLFVGAIVVSVGYELFIAWLDNDTVLTPTASPRCLETAADLCVV
jgi:predicted PurR-regulated permease PerM